MHTLRPKIWQETLKKLIMHTLGPVNPIANCEHPLLCLLGPGIASQETSISGSFSKILLVRAMVSAFGG